MSPTSAGQKGESSSVGHSRTPKNGLKQSLLPFVQAQDLSVPKKITESEKRAAPEAITIDDDSDDGLRTPPPPTSIRRLSTPPLPERQSSPLAAPPVKRKRTLCQDGKVPGSQKSHVLNGSTSASALASSTEGVSTSKKKDNGTGSVLSRATSSSRAKEGGRYGTPIPDALETKASPRNVGEAKICHQHRSACPSQLVRCTRLKRHGIRCAIKFCAASLANVYSEDAEAILGNQRQISKRVDLSLHCGPEDADYIWTCPKCRNVCQCSSCRKKNGLQPLGFNQMGAHKDDKVPELAKKKTTSTGRGSLETMQNVSIKTSLASISSLSNPSNSPLELASLIQRQLPRPLKKPSDVDPPALEVIETKLPTPNIIERIWIYDTLVRFDQFQTPKKILQQLDKFESWTEGQVQRLLEVLVCSIAGLRNIRNGKVVEKGLLGGLVNAVREHGSSVSRGQPWEAARLYCESRRVRVASLENVELEPEQMGDSVAPVRASPVPTSLLADRAARTRRTAETRAMEKVRAMNAQATKSQGDSVDDSQDGDEENSQDGLSREGSESENERPSRNARGKAKMAKSQPEPTRRSLRQAEKELSPLTAISEFEDESDDDGAVYSSRTIRAKVVDSEDEEMKEVGAERRKGGEKEEEKDEDDDEPWKVSLSAPPFETKVAILSALTELAVQKPDVGLELSSGVKEAAVVTKNGKEEEQELVKEQEMEISELKQKAPSMSQKSEYTQWKYECRKMERKHRYALLECQVNAQMQLDTLKLRTGPLGRDVDGNEYWQLSELVERMPMDTGGRWAWSLLIHGQGFPAGKEKENPLKEADGNARQNQLGVSEQSRTDKEEGKGKGKGKAEAKAEAKAGDPEKQGKMVWMGTNTPDDIHKLMSYIRYRLALREYEELVEDCRKEGEMDAVSRAAAIVTEVKGSIDLTKDDTSPSIQVAWRKRAKRQLREEQERRRASVEDLLQQLNNVWRYYRWHLKDDSTPEPESRK